MYELDVLQNAIAEIWDELPELVSESWPEFEQKLLVLLREIEGGANFDESADKVYALFEDYAKAYDRLVEKVAKLQPVRVRSETLHLPAQDRKERYIVVPVLYATDRALTPGAGGPTDRYTGNRGSLGFGLGKVSIPDDHRTGELEKPRWWKLEFHPDPEKHVVVLSVEMFDRDAFTDYARQSIGLAEEPEALVFVHGYNVSFDDALRRTAQIAYDLNFPGVPMLYSWPSEAKPQLYTVDETNIRWTEPHFSDFLNLVRMDLGLKTVHLLAHSMGSRVLAETLGAAVESAPVDDAAPIHQVVFAAPDIDSDTFCRLAEQFSGRASRVTLYASSKDMALVLSKKVHKYGRAGDSGKGLVLVNGIDTVDATDVDTSLVGHSYYGDNRSILSDLFTLIHQGLEPALRFGLVRRETDLGAYWQFRP